MKKNILNLSAIALIAISSVFTGCQKDDVAAPVVTLTGSADQTISLHGTYTEAGATATDEEDGAITPTIAGTVDEDLAGVYTLTYTATDAAGNVGTATRTVTVMHTAATTAGSFAVADLVGGSTTNYTDVLTAASAARVNTTKFANYANTVVYFDLTGATGSIVTVPSQLVTGSGSPAADRTFAGTGTVSDDGKTIIINYTEMVNGSPTVSGVGTYVKP